MPQTGGCQYKTVKLILGREEELVVKIVPKTDPASSFKKIVVWKLAQTSNYYMYTYCVKIVNTE